MWEKKGGKGGGMPEQWGEFPIPIRLIPNIPIVSEAQPISLRCLSAKRNAAIANRKIGPAVRPSFTLPSRQSFITLH